MDSESPHVSVLREECLEYLAIRPEGFYVDCTAGGGGHSQAIAERLTAGRLLALDRDPAALSIAARRLEKWLSAEENTAPKVVLKQAAFSSLQAVIKVVHDAGVDGILADLGMSQMQLNDSARGFSFAADGQLDMR